MIRSIDGNWAHRRDWPNDLADQYAAKLHFQFRVVVRGESSQRRLREGR